ncbi:M60 family metallopeptidase [Chryseobacterium sp. Chry.R1]|uniref:M60 family metallopeptidase n=1 Tax=Chryseobacterium sp. Chry.R1 TaxID=3139392 RepID=UPI0031F8D5F4
MKKNIFAFLNGMFLLLFSSCQSDIMDSKQPENISVKAFNKRVVSNQPTNDYYDVNSLGEKNQMFSEHYSAKYEKDRLQSDFLLTDFMPTGFYVEANKALTLNVEQISGTTLPKLLIGTYARKGISNKPQEVQLAAGLNTITANDKGGLLWVRYGNDLSPSSKVKITFESGYEKVPLFIKNKTESTHFASQILSASAGVDDALLIGQNVYIVLSKRQKDLSTQNNNSILEKIDTYLKLEDDLIGLDNSSDLHRSMKIPQLLTICIPAYAGGFAQSYVAATSYGIKDDFVKIARHEFGHLHQQSWTTQPETIAQFFTISVGVDANIPKNKYAEGYGTWSNVWLDMDDYFNKSIDERDYSKIQNYNARLSGAGWLGAAMLIQLKYAYGNDFYSKLFKITREERPIFKNSSDKYEYFMTKSCKISGYDLTDFFKKWGFKFPNAYSAIAALQLPKPPVDPSTFKDYKD